MDPEQIEALLDEANRLLEAGKPQESLRCLDALADQLVETEDRIECAALRAYALSEIGRIEEALELLEPLLDEFPDSARLLGALGVVLSGANDLEPAREALEAAIALDDEDETFVANLALVYEKLRDYSTALRMYERALEMGADLDWALQRKAATLTEAGDSNAAKATLRRYLSLVPEDGDQWISLAILHSDDDEFAEANACYREAERVDPDSGSLRLNWGVTAVRAGALKLARRQLTHLERIEPDSSRPLLLRAFILEEQGELRQAQRCYARALGLVGDDAGDELAYALEMAMDFYARRELRGLAEHLFERAYQANACTVELCEPYRELTGKHLKVGSWFSLVLEADLRPGLQAVFERSPGDNQGDCRLRDDWRPGSRAPRRGPADESVPPRRYQRNFQVVARDRDEALLIAVDLAERMGEANVLVREFVRDEELEDVFTGVYEVEAESFVLPGSGPASAE